MSRSSTRISYYDDKVDYGRKNHEREPGSAIRSQRRRSRSPRDTYRERARNRSPNPHDQPDEDSKKKHYRSERRSGSISVSRLSPRRPESREHRNNRGHLSPPRRSHDRHRESNGSRELQSTYRSPPYASAHFQSRAPLPSQQAVYSGEHSSTHDQSVEKQKPNYNPSGKLAAETNTVTGTDIVLKYNEPPEARKPPASQSWRLYVFKGSATLDTVELGTRSCWLFGREVAVVDFPTEHPSCSKQHAVLQFRYLEKKNEYGDKEGRVRPYVIDLESANGTQLNGDALPARRYVEVRSGDMLSFGESTREYVLMLPPVSG